MKRSAASIFFGITLIAILGAPLQTHAALFSGPIVPTACHCDNQTAPGSSGPISTAPDWGCVLQVIQNLINFGITLAMVLTSIYLVITGISFITSAGSSEARSKAKTRFTNVFLGLAVLLCAWLLVDYLMKHFYDEGKFGPWNSILAGTGTDQCIKPTTPISITSGSLNSQLPTTGTNAGTTGDTTAGGDRCAGIPSSNLVNIDNAGHQLTTEAAVRFANMKAAAAKAGINLVVTSAYRSPEQQVSAWNQNGCTVVNGKAVCQKRTAAIPCSMGGSGSNHSLGTAVDIQLTSGVQAWLNQNGGQYGFINALPNDLVHYSNTGR